MLGGIEVAYSSEQDTVTLKGIEFYCFTNEDAASDFWREVGEAKRTSYSELDIVHRARHLLKRAFASKVLVHGFVSSQDRPPLKLVPLSYARPYPLKMVLTQKIWHTHNCPQEYNYKDIIHQMLKTFNSEPRSLRDRDQLYENIFDEWREAHRKGWVAIQDRC